VGDTAWKKSILDAKDPTEPLAPAQGEAFAMLLLKNNYFAWLWEAKNQYKDLLVTVYDTKKQQHESKLEDVGYVCLQCQLKALGKASDEDDDLSSSNDEGQQSELLEQTTAHQPEQLSGLIEQRTKKQEILKSFQAYTNSNKEEGKFKGRSLRAGEELSRLIEKLSKVTSKEKLFHQAYQHTFKQKLVASGKKKKSNQEPKPVNYQSKIWGLEIIEEVEI
jgi:hypothetical protein